MLTQERAKEAFTNAKKLPGPWADHIAGQLTRSELDYAKQLWESDSYDGEASFMTVFFDIMNGRVPEEYPEDDDSPRCSDCGEQTTELVATSQGFPYKVCKDCWIGD